MMRMPRAPCVAAHVATTSSIAGSVAFTLQVVSGLGSATPDARIFGTNMGLYDGNEQMFQPATQAILEGWHTPVVRMPFRGSLSDGVELQALNAIKTMGATPLVIVHGAVDSTVLSDDQHLLALTAQVFGSSTVYVEYGNEEDLAGVNDEINAFHGFNVVIVLAQRLDGDDRGWAHDDSRRKYPCCWIAD